MGSASSASKKKSSAPTAIAEKDALQLSSDKRTAQDQPSKTFAPPRDKHQSGASLFLSHRQADWGDVCHALSIEMQERGLGYAWFDMRADLLVTKVMERAIEEASIYVVFLSPSLVTEKNFVIHELNTALSLKKTIVAIIDETSDNPRRRISDRANYLTALAKKLNVNKDVLGEPIRFAYGSGPAHDEMLTAIAQRGNVEFKPLRPANDPFASIKDPELLLACHPRSGMDACELLVRELVSRGIRCQILRDAKAIQQQNSASLRGIVFYLTKGALKELVAVIQFAAQKDLGSVYLYESDKRREGSLESPDRVFEEAKAIPELKNLSDKSELLEFGKLTRRDGFMDVLLRKILMQISGPSPLSVPFDPLLLPRTLSMKYEPGTREWFFDEVDRSDNNAKVVVVVDTAGRGKSVLMAETCRRGSAALFPSSSSKLENLSIGGFHFFDSSQVLTTSVAACFGSICVLLCSHVQGFRMQLPLDLDHRIQGASATELFDMLLANPVAAVAHVDKVWVVIDGLDECDEPGEVLRALRRYYQSVGNATWLRFMISTRSLPSLDESDDFRVIRLEKHQEKDLAFYLNVRLERSWAVPAKAREELIQKISKLAEGNFLWIAYQEPALRTLAEKSLTVEDLKTLPSGINAAYEKYFDSLKKALGAPMFNKVIGVGLIAPRAPLPQSILSRALNIKSTSDFDEKVREPASRLLIFDEAGEGNEGQTFIRAPHKSMREWLAQAKIGSAAEFHGELAAVLAVLATDAFRESDCFVYGPPQGLDAVKAFAVQHLLYHHMKAGKSEVVLSEWVANFPKLLFLVHLSGSDTVLADCEALVEELDHEKHDLVQLVSFVAGVLRLGSTALKRDHRELASQILGRANPSTRQLPIIKGAKEWLDRAVVSRGLRVAVPTEHFSGLRPASGHLIRSLRGHADSVFAVASDGKRVLSCSNDSTARVWGESRTLLKEFTLHKGDVNCSALVGEFAVTGANDSLAIRWSVEDAPNASPPMVFAGHTNAIYSIHVDPESNLLITGSWDKTAMVWDWKKGGKPMITLDGHAETVYGVHISKNIAVTGAESIRIWEVNPAKSAATVIRTIELKTAPSITCMCVTPTLIFAAGDEMIERFRIEDGEALPPIPNGAKICSLDVSRNVLVTGSQDHLIRVFDLDVSASTPMILEGHSNWVASVRVTPDRKQIVSGAWDKTVCAWRMPSMEEARHVPHAGHSKYTTCVDVQGDFVATGALDKTVRVWSLKTGELLHCLDAGFGVYDVVWTKSGTLEATDAENKAKKSWTELAGVTFKGSEPRIPVPGGSGIYIGKSSADSVGFTADDDTGCQQQGKWLVGTSGHKCRIWHWHVAA